MKLHEVDNIILPCVYKIYKFRVAGCKYYYIGCSVRPENRLSEHKRLLSETMHLLKRKRPLSKKHEMYIQMAQHLRKGKRRYQLQDQLKKIRFTILQSCETSFDAKNFEDFYIKSGIKSKFLVNRLSSSGYTHIPRLRSFLYSQRQNQ